MISMIERLENRYYRRKAMKKRRRVEERQRELRETGSITPTFSSQLLGAGLIGYCCAVGFVKGAVSFPIRVFR